MVKFVEPSRARRGGVRREEMGGEDEGARHVLIDPEHARLALRPGALPQKDATEKDLFMCVSGVRV